MDEKNQISQNVVVVGASDKPHRYSYLALALLKEKGHRVFPVHQRIQKIDGLDVYRSIADIPDKIDTITMYVGKETSDKLAGEIMAAHPQRIIFNPGAENAELEEQVQKQGIRALRACTLVLLKTGQF